MALKQWGLAGIAFDYNFGGRYNNFFEPSGFAFPAQFIYHFLLNHSKNYASMGGQITSWLAGVFSFFWPLRLAILAILRLHPCSLVILAPVCSSMSFMCSSQAGRYWYSPLGNEELWWVKSANVMSCRVTLLAWLATAPGHTFMIEQPSSAKFGDMPRWRFFCEIIAYVTLF